MTTSALSDAARVAVAQLWSSRAAAEHVAVQRFSQLGVHLRRAGHSSLAALAAEASADEARHEILCERMARRYGGTLLPKTSPPRLGPALPADRSTLYVVVAVACVAESINAALLQRTLLRATDPETVSATKTLLGDEVRHAQLGWATLSAFEDRAWLAPLLPRMLEATAPVEMRRHLQREVTCSHRVSHGLLAPAERWALLLETLRTVVLPGFEHFGVSTVASRDWLQATWSSDSPPASVPT